MFVLEVAAATRQATTLQKGAFLLAWKLFDVVSKTTPLLRRKQNVVEAETPTVTHARSAEQEKHVPNIPLLKVAGNAGARRRRGSKKSPRLFAAVGF
jgi:hypothetical protein